jgi:hypothetical protein
MTVIPISAVIRYCAINSGYKVLIGFHIGNQIQILSDDVLRSKAATVTQKIIGSNWKDSLRKIILYEVISHVIGLLISRKHFTTPGT